jgi:hypothetical protein
MTCEAENQVLRGFMAIIDGLLNKAENEELKAQQAIRAARIQGVEEGQKLSNARPLPRPARCVSSRRCWMTERSASLIWKSS